VVTPFAAVDESKVPLIGPHHLIHRCGVCFGYLSPLCHLRTRWWACGLCGHHNQLPSKHGLHLDSPELNALCVEYALPLDSHPAALGDAVGTLTSDSVPPPPPGAAGVTVAASRMSHELPADELPPVVLALLDETADAWAIEAVCAGLEEFIQQCPPEVV
jgi:hypothetical protein